MRKIALITFLIIIGLSSTAVEPDSLVIFFWNVENLFYPENDSLREDDDFTPVGDRYWRWEKYQSKINRVWKTIMATGDPLPPEIITLAEIESHDVLEDLFIYSPPGMYEYEIIHHESNDRRGIDLAILFDPERVIFKKDSIFPVCLEKVGGGPTRDILFAEFQWQNESFSLFVNHWPSKYGGAGVTEKFRLTAAVTLSNIINKILTANVNANLVCLGDFNDTEESSSIQYLLNKTNIEIVPFYGNSAPGTYKYQGKWQNIDHIMVSSSLMNGSNNLKAGHSVIYAPDFLLEKDDLYGGIKPFRTWKGYSYRKGFSDHLPVMIRLFSLIPAH